MTGPVCRMKRAKTIDELYEEVKDYDLVITNDAPLATAINARVDRPMLGYLATTPLKIAQSVATTYLGTGTMNDLELVSLISDQVGCKFKRAYSEILNIRNILKYRSDPEGYLISRRSKLIYQVYKRYPTLDKVMLEFVPEDSDFYQKFIGDKVRIAVIGAEPDDSYQFECNLYDNLDKHMLPPPGMYDNISLFTDGEFEIPEIRVVGNDRQIADSVVSMIGSEGIDPEDVAIVMDTTAPVADAVRSNLYKRKIPFKNNMSVRDLSQLRDLIKFLELALDFDTIRLGQAREILSTYGAFFGNGEDAYFISRMTIDGERNPRGCQLFDIMRRVRELTFGQLSGIVASGFDLSTINTVLTDLDLYDMEITAERVSELKYAVDNVKVLHHNEQIPEDEKRGVLLADCSRSIYVDRPVVFFLGLGQEWDSTVVDKRFVDKDEERSRAMLRLVLLLQQGSSRIYAVNYMKNGKKAIPCALFNDMLNKPLTGFEDICRIVRDPWSLPEKMEMMRRGSFNMEEPASIYLTKSDYNSYRQCPRMYLLKKIVRSDDTKYTMFGNLIHEFAELCYTYPDVVSSKGIDHFVDIAMEDYSRISSKMRESLDRTALKRSMISLRNTLKDIPSGGHPLELKNSDRKYPNTMLAHEGLDLVTDETESEYKAFPMFGKMDLVIGNCIYDYKTGKKKPTMSECMKKFLGRAEDPDYQPIMYLHMLHSRLGSVPSDGLSFIHLYTSEEEMLREPSDRITCGTITTVFRDREIKKIVCTDEFISSVFGTKTLEPFVPMDPNDMLYVKEFVDHLGRKMGEDEARDTYDENFLHLMRIFNIVRSNKKGEIEYKKSNRDKGRSLVNRFFDNYDVRGAILSDRGEKYLEISHEGMQEFLVQIEEDREKISKAIVGQEIFDADPASKKCERCDFKKACTLTFIGGDEDE